MLSCCPATVEAERTEPFKYTKCLQDPLAPRILNFQQQQTVTLHLHSFHYVSASAQQQQQGSASDVLYLAVGAPLRCKAIPGGRSGSNAAAAAADQTNSFGVLTWAQLPGALASNSSGRDGPSPLEFPAWLSHDQHEPSVVSNCCSAEPLKLSVCNSAYDVPLAGAAVARTVKCCASRSALYTSQAVGVLSCVV